MKRFFAAAGLVLSLISCDGVRLEEGYESMFCISCEGNAQSKSSLSEAAFTIHNINVFVYDSRGLATAVYSCSGSNVTVIFPDAEANYDVFFLVNAGEVTAPSKETDLRDLVLDFPALTYLSDGGIPMVGSLSSYRPVERTSVKVEMLCSQIELTLDRSALTAEYSPSSVRLRNSARTVLPFSDVSSADETISFGDSLSSEEVKSLVSGGRVYLYTLENMQGKLLPFNDDPFKKIPANLPSSALSSKCTFLEVVADVRTPVAFFKDVIFRTYLGSDLTSDFNLKRSRSYKYKLNFETNMIRDEEWRIDTSAPSVVGGLKISKMEANVIKGITDTVFVYPESANGKEMSLDIYVDGSTSGKDDMSMEVKNMKIGGKDVKALIFSTTRPIDGLNPYGSEPEYKLHKVKICSRESFGGTPMLSCEFAVKEFHQVFPIYLRTRTSGSECTLYAYSNNPLGVKFSGSILCREGQSTSGRKTFFNNVEPSHAGACLGNLSCYEDGTAVFLEMNPIVGGEACKMYMGDLSKEYFGPGADHSPAMMSEYPDDGWYEMDDLITTEALSRDYRAILSCSSGYLFRLDSLTTGWNCQDRYRYEGFEGRPFYFINGGLEFLFVGKYEDGPKYLDDSGRVGYMVYAYEPGRDLGLDKQYDSRGSCTFGAQLGTMRQFWGNVHTWMAWREYDYRIYLSINGCSCWAGATKGIHGYVVN